MRTQSVFTLAVVGWLAWSAAAWGQVRHPEGDLEQKAPAVLYKKKKPDQPPKAVKVWVAHAGYKPTELPAPDAPTVGLSNPIEFLERFYCAAEWQNYYLLVRSENAKDITGYVGWVQRDHLITDSEARKDAASSIYYKAMVVNTLDMLGQTKDQVLASKLPIRSAPQEDAPLLEDQVTLFGVYFIYGEAKSGQSKNYLLLGGSPLFNELGGASAARQVVKGWVPEERIQRWKTRQAVSWDYRTTLPEAPFRRANPARIFKTPDDALGESTPGVLFEEQFNEQKVSPPPKPDDIRFPLLDWFDAKGRKETEFEESRRGRLYRVGVVGGFRGRDRKEVLSRDKIATVQKEFTGLKAEIEQTEVLFIIDDTDSMRDWFPRVAEVFDELVELISRDPDRKVRIGLAYYNDITKDNKDPVKVFPLADYRTQGRAFAEELRGHQPHDGGDPLEMVFRGIIEGIDGAGFSDVARKMVVVIGDCGDRDDDPLYSIPKIVNKLLPREKASPIEFYGVQVKDPATGTDEKAFQDQMQKIVADLQDAGRRKGRDITAGYYKAYELAPFKDRILERYQTMQKEWDAFAAGLRKVSQGMFRSTVFSTEQERLIRQRLEQLNDPDLTLDKLKNLPEGFQLFEPGYVWKTNDRRVSQVTPCLLLNDDELRVVTELIGRLESVVPSARPSLKDVVAGLVKSVVGEQQFKDDPTLMRQSVNDIIRKSTGLMFQSKLMNTPLEKIENDDLSVTDYYHLLHRCQLLKDIREGVAYEYVAKESSDAGEKVTRYVRTAAEAKAVKRGFNLPGDTLIRWYWIEQDQEWP